MAALVALVREAVITVGAEIGGLQNTVDQSADRFESISQIQDPNQIKERLVAEVTALKHVATERRQIWETTSKKFNERVETLERQLVSSRTEASLDSLTGVANRRTFDRTCQDWVRSARSRFVLAMLDVDDFKTINDTRGHAAGDQVLVTLAQALLGSVRPGDIVARLGGDEFAILASDLTLRQAENRFSKTISDLGVSRCEGQLRPRRVLRRRHLRKPVRAGRPGPLRRQARRQASRRHQGPRVHPRSDEAVMNAA